MDAHPFYWLFAIFSCIIFALNFIFALYVHVAVIRKARYRVAASSWRLLKDLIKHHKVVSAAYFAVFVFQVLFSLILMGKVGGDEQCKQLQPKFYLFIRFMPYMVGASAVAIVLGIFSDLISDCCCGTPTEADMEAQRPIIDEQKRLLAEQKSLLAQQKQQVPQTPQQPPVAAAPPTLSAGDEAWLSKVDATRGK